jgi:hypothetical protein
VAGGRVNRNPIIRDVLAVSDSLTYHIGVPPGRIDIVHRIDGLTFVDAGLIVCGGRSARLRSTSSDAASFIRNKRATGRPKDLGDIEGTE